MIPNLISVLFITLLVFSGCEPSSKMMILEQDLGLNSSEGTSNLRSPDLSLSPDQDRLEHDLSLTDMGIQDLQFPEQVEDQSLEVLNDQDLPENSPLDFDVDLDMLALDLSLPVDMSILPPETVDQGTPPEDIEWSTTPIFAEMFTPAHTNGQILDRWDIQGICAPTQARVGMYCAGGPTGSGSIQTQISTMGYQDLILSYMRIPNNAGGYEENERFVVEWSQDGTEPWYEIESSRQTEAQHVEFPLPQDAHNLPHFTLRFKTISNSNNGGESFWLNSVVIRARVPRCTQQEWVNQFQPPYQDPNGHFIGGSEIFRIVRHQGELFATNTYWMDENNPWYGMGDQWGQILRKSRADEVWQEEYDLGFGVLRPEILQSIHLTQPETRSLLIASTFRIQNGRYYIDVWTRNDQTQHWTLTTPHEGPNPADSHDISVRQLSVHTDQVTGEERIILSVGTQGMLEGRYREDVPGQIEWFPLIPVAFNERAMGMTIANQKVVVGAGNQIWHRQDGPNPQYTLVHTMQDLIADELLRPPMGTYRGMTTIQHPELNQESILFSWAPDYISTGVIYRLDPQGEGYRRVIETDIGDLLSAQLGVPVWTSLCTYSYFLPVVHPQTGKHYHLGGCLNVIGGDQYPFWVGQPGSGHYKGGIYFIRDEYGSYLLREVKERHNGEDPPRDAIRAIELSPFEAQSIEGQQVYFGGHDSAGEISTNLAWMYSASLNDVLEQCAD